MLVLTNLLGALLAASSCSSIYDAGNVRTADTKQRCKATASNTFSGKLSNLHNIFYAQTRTFSALGASCKSVPSMGVRHVLRVGTGTQMVRPYAPRIITFVQHKQTIGDWAVAQSVRESMRARALLAVHAPVEVTCTTEPDPTRPQLWAVLWSWPILTNSTPKTFFRCTQTYALKAQLRAEPSLLRANERLSTINAVAYAGRAHRNRSPLGRDPGGASRAGSVVNQLVLAIFRVGVHEGALANVREVSLVAQCARQHGATPAKQLAWLELHSPRAMGLRTDFSPNAWAATLSSECDPPEPFDPQWWYVRRWPRCLSVYHLVGALVRGRVHDEPCIGEQPETWGNPSSVSDSRWAARHGLRRLHCAGVLNDGYR